MKFKKNYTSLCLTIISVFTLWMPEIYALSRLTDTEFSGTGATSGVQDVAGAENTSSDNVMQITQTVAGLDARADSFDFIGDNMIATGNVFVRRGDMLLYSDKAIINNTNKNIELSGNVKFYRVSRSREEIEYWDLKDLEKDPHIKLKVVGTTMSPTGRQLLVVDSIRETLAWSGNRTIGNLKSGVFEFGQFDANLSGWYTMAGHAKRYKDGKLTIHDSTLSPCPGLMEGNALMSLKSSKLVAIPSSPRVSKSLDSQTGVVNPSAMSMSGYHLWAYNNVFYVAGIPVMWLPVVYKPPPGKTGLWRFSTGGNTDYGYYLQTANYWNIWDSDGVNIDTLNLIDYYQYRGLALGNRTRIHTDNSQTDFFVYSVLDDERANYSVPDQSRFKSLNTFRYYLNLRNKTHITDRMDFRGRLGVLSDYYFLNDFFDDIFRVDPQPSTYANLNYQFDWGTLNFNVHPKINKFFTAVEELPKLELNVPRQEIWNNIHYQSKSNVAYMRMNWTEFNQPRPGGAGNPENYEAFRFDTVHFAYYPLNLGWLNIVPRGGFRLTAYSKSTEQKVNDLALDQLIDVSKPENFTDNSPLLANYDSKGGGKARFIPEVGLQLSTKMSRSWDDMKNTYWEMNGLRHVFQPYINYTLLAPTSSRDYVYYFDDTDRIDTQHFVRFGLENRLQTRRGGWKNSQVYTWASMQNYLDVLIDDSNRNNVADILGTNTGSVNYIGDFGHVITINPNEDLQITLNLLMDGGKLFKGQIADSFADSNLQVNYNFADGWGVFGNWYYSTENTTTPVISMGSELTQVESGTYFQRMFGNASYTQSGLNFKINERTFGQAYLEYDFRQNIMPDFNINLNRELPCGLMLVLSYSLSKRKNTDGSGVHVNQGVNASLNFTTTPHYSIAPKESLLPEYMGGAPEGAPVIGSPLAPANEGI